MNAAPPARPVVAPQRAETLMAVYRQEWDGMVRLAYLLTGSHAVAEDVVQDAFVKLYDVLDGVERPGAYLRTTVVNMCRSHHRREQVEQRWLARQPGPASVLSPELDETWKALSRLPEPQREALVLRFYLDLKVADVAAALDRPVGSVKAQIHRGLAALSKEIDR